MKKKIVIIDYQLSNLFSVKNACASVGFQASISSDKTEILDADAAILPGVGAFADAMLNLNKLNLINPIKEFINSGRKFMGICLGLQLLFSVSEEFGEHKGLDIIKGKVVRFSNFSVGDEKKTRVPNIGWNRIFKANKKINIWKQTPLKNLKEGEFMYFVHSYYVVPEDNTDILSITTYGNIKYCSSIFRDNLFAVQFHPEKSGIEGIKIYKDWISSI
jgi:imidazole glycerol-phosphate synthase subunit HisH